MDALKCHPDMSPLSLHWVVNEVAPVVNWNGARHTCANWDRVMEWAGRNQIVPTGKDNLGQGKHHAIYHKPRTNVLTFLSFFFLLVVAPHPLYGMYMKSAGSFVVEEAG